MNEKYKINGTMFNKGTTIQVERNGDKLQFDGKLYSSITIAPQISTSVLTIKTESVSRNYRGTVILKVDGENILPVNQISVDDYLKGVVGYEMSNFYPLEALKAQAVAARNYTFDNLGKYRSKGYDLCDTVNCQVYNGYEPSFKNVIKAVDDTSGILLYYGNSLVKGYFHASNGGYTEASENVWVQKLGYLVSKIDIYDGPGKYPSFFKKGRWTSNFRTQDIEAALKSKGYIKNEDRFESISDITYFDRGRIASLKINYNDKNNAARFTTLTKEKARSFLGLRSALYTVSYNKTTDIYTFKGEGYGHGIGMSQIGAYNRAAAGHKYDAILKFYYQGSKIKKINPSSIGDESVK